MDAGLYLTQDQLDTLRLLIIGLVVMAIALHMTPSCDCTPRHVCKNDPRCPLCFRRHDPKERCL